MIKQHKLMSRNEEVQARVRHMTIAGVLPSIDASDRGAPAALDAGQDTGLGLGMGVGQKEGVKERSAIGDLLYLRCRFLLLHSLWVGPLLEDWRGVLESGVERETRFVERGANYLKLG